ERLGTASDIAPEQAAGRAHTVRPPADVWALGAILYELLAGRPPFRGASVSDTLEQVGQREPVPPSRLQPKVPRDLETACLKCLEKEPRRRYATAEELAEDLRRYLADEPIRARRIGPVERLGRWGRRNPLVAGLSAAVVLVTAVGFAAVFGQMQVAVGHAQRANAKAVLAQEKEREASQQRD